MYYKLSPLISGVESFFYCWLTFILFSDLTAKLFGDNHIRQNSQNKQLVSINKFQSLENRSELKKQP